MGGFAQSALHPAVNRSDHIAQAIENRDFTIRLTNADDVPSWRWATVVAYYAAHHWLHALCAEQAALLPPDFPRFGPRRRKPGSFVHPDTHGTEPGGNRRSLLLLSHAIPDLEPLNLVFSQMLDHSHTARYGLRGERNQRFWRGDATSALARLERFESLITERLR
jgi:hypothetical protein